MEETGFRPGDHLYRNVQAAYDAIHGLHVEAHYLSCRGCVGREPRR